MGAGTSKPQSAEKPEACLWQRGQGPNSSYAGEGVGGGTKYARLLAPNICRPTLHTHHKCSLVLAHKGSHCLRSHLGRRRKPRAVRGRGPGPCHPPSRPRQLPLGAAVSHRLREAEG